MTRFVLAHFMYRIVNRIQVQLFGQCSDTLLVLACAALGLHTGLDIGLRVPDDLAQQLGELGGMFGFLPCITLESLGNPSRSA